MESEYREFEKYYDKIYRYCFDKVKNVHTAEDLTQETFLKFLRGGYQGEGKELNFLYTVARNLCIDEFRKRKCEVFVENFSGEGSLGKQGFSGDTSTEGFERSVVDRILVKEALERLTEEERELLMLRYGNGEPLEVMAGFYGISRFALYRRLKKAEKRFRRFMEK